MNAENYKEKVFLCHSSDDKEIVRQLNRKLKSHGIKTWLDEDDIIGGMLWQDEIEKAVKYCQIVLVCLSNNSVSKTGYLNKEIKFVLDRADEQPEGKIYLIPVRLDDCEVPHRLSKWQWIDLFKDGGYEKLLKSLPSIWQSKDNSDLLLVSELDYKLADNNPQSYGVKVQLKRGDDLIWNEVVVQLTVINIGFLPKQIISIFIEDEKQVFEVVTPELPELLTPQTRIELSLQPELFAFKTIAFGVFDALGNKYLLNQESLNKLERQIQELPLRVQEYRHKDTGNIVKAFYTPKRDRIKIKDKFEE
jgi:hypothetical protein